MIIAKRAAQLVVEIDAGAVRDFAAAFAHATTDVDDFLLQRVALACELRLASRQSGIAILLQDLPHIGQLFFALFVDLFLHRIDGGGELSPLLFADRGLNLEELVVGDLAPTPRTPLVFHGHLNILLCPFQYL